jgi:hypothetical protein
VYVIAFSYIMTARHLVESSFSVSEETPNPQMNTRKITAKIVLGLAHVFQISYVPYHALKNYNIVNEEGFLGKIILNKNYNLQYIRVVLTGLLVFNSCHNPVALLCTNLAVRKQFKHYLRPIHT